jgi:hypothetical protein
VEIIDWTSKVLVIDLVPPAVCRLLRSTITQHCLTQQRNGQVTWRTLYTYTKRDLPCCEIAKVNEIAQQLIDTINGLLSLLFGHHNDDDHHNNNNDDDHNNKNMIVLRPRSWKEPHFLRYEHADNYSSSSHQKQNQSDHHKSAARSAGGTGGANSTAPVHPISPISPPYQQQQQQHVGVESHYDGSDFTWSLMLSRPDEYCGGGTYLRTLRTTLRLDQGQVLLHPGELYHTGLNITSGVREYVVFLFRFGFVALLLFRVVVCFCYCCCCCCLLLLLLLFVVTACR